MPVKYEGVDLYNENELRLLIESSDLNIFLRLIKITEQHATIGIMGSPGEPNVWTGNIFGLYRENEGTEPLVFPHDQIARKLVLFNKIFELPTIH